MRDVEDEDELLWSGWMRRLVLRTQFYGVTVLAEEPDGG